MMRIHKTKICLIVLAFIVFAVFKGEAQNSSEADGKCYATAIMPDQYEEVSNKYPEYTGDNVVQNDNVEKVDVLIKPGKKAWVKKKMDNCQGSGDDCLVWCYVDTPGETISIHVVKDPATSKDFTWTEILQYKLVKKGGYSEKVEIACKKKINSQILNQIQAGLVDAGFDPGKSSKRMNGITKRALANFQKANNLPVGQLDLLTLNALNVSLK